MPRAIWKGAISFGLVHVPIALYSGEERDELHLSMLDRRDISPVGYKRINKTTGEEVPWEEIVRGYEYEKDRYVVLSDEELRQANIESTQTIEIIDFVSPDEIPLIYYDRPYFLEPDKRGEKGYALLREILHRTKKAGIAQLVLHTRQHIAALLPFGNALLLNLLRYPNELRTADDLKVPANDLSELGLKKQEIEMAERLVESMVTTWAPEKYHDEYRDDVMQLIEKKIQAGETQLLREEVVQSPARRGAEIIDLMAALKKSVQEREQHAAKKSIPQKAHQKKTKAASRRRAS